MGARKKDEAPVIVKKVKPYPILTKVIKSETAPPFEGQILRLTKIGFQMEIPQLSFSVGDFYIVDFVLPLSNQTIREKVRVVRTMDRFKDEKATVKSYLVEMHFTSISIQNLKLIGEFMSSINQKAA